VAGLTRIKYTIQRDGRLTDIQLEQSSGYFALDQAAQRAIVLTRQLPPLPAQFPEPTLTVHLNFPYER
jgi:TonB family protein